MKLSLYKRHYYKNNIFSYGNNLKKCYSITRKLLGNESHLNYPPFSNEKLCSLFIDHFDSKVINMCNKINNIGLNEDITPFISVPIVSTSFDIFLHPSIVDIYNYIITSTSSSFFDPILLSVLKQLTNTITPIFSKIIIDLLNNCEIPNS